MFRLFRALVVAVLAVSAVSPTASANEARDIQIVITDSNFAPMESVIIKPVNLAQAPQTTSANGSTTWKLAASSHRFTASINPKLSPWIESAEIQFTVKVETGGTNNFVIKLPKLVSTRIPILDGASFSGTLVPIKWGGSSAVEVTVNGQTESTTATSLPKRLFISESSGLKFGHLSYFESPKLSRQNFRDKDGDLIPDASFEIQTRFGSVTYNLLSSQVSSSPASLSLSQVPHVQIQVSGSTISLSVFEGSTDATNLFPTWSFMPLGIDGSWAFATFVKGQNLQLNYSYLPADRRLLISFRSNNILLAEEPWDIPTSQTLCTNLGSGKLDSFETLGECPAGWRLQSESLALADKRFTNCASLNKSLPGGVARTNAVNKGKRTYKFPLTSISGYSKNKHLDSDKDGISCER